MNIDPCTASGFVISNIPGLDPITVLFRDTAPGAGHLIVACYDKAWSSYWGAMGAHSVRSFVAECDDYYLLRSLIGNLIGSTRLTKRDSEYVSRVVHVVAEACRMVQP